MRHILFLEGSPRHGNTEQVTDWIAAGIGKGVKLTRIRLVEQNIHECRECFGCAESKKAAGCRQDDGMLEIYDLMVDADLTVFTSPIFCWGVSGITKVCLDRCFALLTGEDLLKGAKWAVVLTAGGDHFDGADLAVEMFSRLARFAGAKLAGRHVVANCPDGRKLKNNKAIQQAAKEFGKELGKALKD